MLRLVLFALNFFASFSWEPSDSGQNLDPNGQPKPTSDTGRNLDPNG